TSYPTEEVDWTVQATRDWLASLSAADRFAVWEQLRVSERVALWFGLWHHGNSLNDFLGLPHMALDRRADARARGSSILMHLITMMMTIDDPSIPDDDPWIDGAISGI